MIVVISPDGARHPATVVGVALDSGCTVALCVRQVHAHQLRPDDKRGAVWLATHRTLTLHFGCGHDIGPDGTRYPTAFADSAGGRGLASGTWADASGWRWERGSVRGVVGGGDVA